MKRNCYRTLMLLAVGGILVFGNGLAALAAETEAATTLETDSKVPEDGIYTAEFDTDSGMFHVNEANEGRGILTVKNGEMILHVSLASKGIVNLFPGTAEEAKKEGARLLEPTVDTVTYSDGLSEEVYGFDIPVPALEEAFDLALIGKKEKCDHKVSVSDPRPATEEELERLVATEMEETEK